MVYFVAPAVTVVVRALPVELMCVIFRLLDSPLASISINNRIDVIKSIYLCHIISNFSQIKNIEALVIINVLLMQQTPKPSAHVPSLVPPFDSHSCLQRQ